MQQFSISPREMASSLWRYRGLIRTMTKREVLGRYRGSVMGVLWSFFNPLLMLAVYTFVFSVVFRARWSTDTDSRAEFALVLFAGLTVFNLFAETISRAPSLILANANYVKKVVFPLEILPCVTMGSALFHALISFGVWLVAYLALFGTPHATIVLFPLILIPFVLFVMGLAWLLASLGVYLRDVSQVIGVVTTALLFLSPIFYPAAALPEAYRSVLFLNPLTPAVESARDVLFWGTVPDMAMLAGYLAAATVTAWLGFAWFQKTRKGFADVL